MDDLYQEIILDHAQNPRNFGTLDHPTITIKEANASCGDMIEMQLFVENDVVKDVKWRGVGCAISTASSSAISDMMIGKTLNEVKSIQKSDVLNVLGIKEILPTREKCLLLPLRALQQLEK